MDLFIIIIIVLILYILIRNQCVSDFYSTLHTHALRKCRTRKDITYIDNLFDEILYFKMVFSFKKLNPEYWFSEDDIEKFF